MGAEGLITQEELPAEPDSGSEGSSTPLCPPWRPAGARPRSSLSPRWPMAFESSLPRIGKGGDRPVTQVHWQPSRRPWESWLLSPPTSKMPSCSTTKVGPPGSSLGWERPPPGAVRLLAATSWLVVRAAAGHAGKETGPSRLVSTGALRY